MKRILAEVGPMVHANPHSLENLRAYIEIADEFFLFDASTCPPTPVVSKTPTGIQIETPATFRKISPYLDLP